jgi:hypothetical protein
MSNNKLVTLSYPAVGVDVVSEEKINSAIQTVEASVDALADTAQVSQWAVKDVQAAHDRIEKRKVEIAEISPRLEALEQRAALVLDMSPVDEKLKDIYNNIEGHFLHNEEKHKAHEWAVADLRANFSKNFIDLKSKVSELELKISELPKLKEIQTNIISTNLPLLTLPKRIKWLLTGKVD